MKRLENIKRPVFLVMFALAVTIAGGCASMGQQGPAAAGPAAAEEPAWEIEPWEGDGLDIPLDGSSKEAWQRSLARVKAHTTEDDYGFLENAIEYLLVYDIAARGDMDRLIARLDGMTGYDIIEQVRWRKPSPGKGPAEKDATDASLIDA